MLFLNVRPMESSKGNDSFPKKCRYNVMFLSFKTNGKYEHQEINQLILSTGLSTSPLILNNKPVLAMRQPKFRKLETFASKLQSGICTQVWDPISSSLNYSVLDKLVV